MEVVLIVGGKNPLVRCVRGKTNLPWVFVDRSSFEGGCSVPLSVSEIEEASVSFFFLCS